MQKITFLFFFILINTTLLFSQDKSIEFTQQYTSNDNYIGAKSEVFKMDYKKTSPFIMLSGYSNSLTYNGTAHYRLKVSNNWTEWQSFPEAHEGEITDRVPLGIVYIDHAFENIQFKVDKTDNSKFVFRLFLPDFTGNLKIKNSNKAATKQQAGGCAQPTYQGRLDWCPSGDCPKSSSPSAINPTHIVVHHSAGQTNSTDYAAVVRGYWDYHVNSRGWADIGYNWLVDPNGVLYEGRGDRIRGAHSPCMNAVATGICYIGNYDTFEPAVAGLTALKNFIAWDATDKNIDVTVSSFVSALGGNIENISGHKDGFDQYPTKGCTSTACPGANLHNKLQTIRDDVAAYSCYISSANAPDIPLSFSIIRKSTTSAEVKIKAVATATKYGVYKSTDNTTYQKVEESSSTTITINNLTQGEVTYIKVEAINDDGVSEKSTPLAVIASQYISDILIVDGVERRQFEAIAQYDYPLSQLERTFSSVTNDAVQDGTVNLSDFKFVIWMLMDESSADDTFNKTEQTKVKSYIDNGGVFIVSGDELGWDLVHLGDATDIAFYENYLKAEYIADNPTPNNRIVKDNNSVSYNLDDGSHGTFDADFPDLIKAKNGSVKTFTYDGVGESTGIAGVSYQTTNGGVEYLGFALEAIYNDTQRKNLIDYILQKYSSLLAVDDTFIKQNIRLYPNPTSGIIKISNPNFIKISTVEIYNIYGQQLQSKSLKNNIDLSNYTTGIYFIKIEDQNGKQGSFKVIKN